MKQQSFVTPPRPRRRKGKRLSWEKKTRLIVETIEKNVDYHALIHGTRGVGFRMKQIADMTGYQKSGPLMTDLYRMVDEGILYMEDRDAKSPLSKIEFIFYTPRSWEQRPKQLELFNG